MELCKYKPRRIYVKTYCNKKMHAPRTGTGCQLTWRNTTRRSPPRGGGVGPAFRRGWISATARLWRRSDARTGKPSHVAGGDLPNGKIGHQTLAPCKHFVRAEETRPHVVLHTPPHICPSQLTHHAAVPAGVVAVAIAS
jgi:hypothetical protein